MNATWKIRLLLVALDMAHLRLFQQPLNTTHQTNKASMPFLTLKPYQKNNLKFKLFHDQFFHSGYAAGIYFY